VTPNRESIVKVFGIAGSSGSGKSTLLDQLIPVS
jgi:molybdopterin-guanine dinucleotide biosynthesis protein B